MRVDVPEELSAGVVDLRSYGEGQVSIETDERGRYVDVESQQAAQAVTEAYGTSIRGESESDPDEADDAGTCTTTLGSGEECGRDLPCQYHSEDA